MKTRRRTATAIGGAATALMLLSAPAVWAATMGPYSISGSSNITQRFSVPGCVIDGTLLYSTNRAQTYNYAGCTNVSARHYWVSGQSGGYTAWKTTTTTAIDSAAATIQFSQHKATY